MFDFFEFILFVLACWRVTWMFTQEDGPYDMFLRIRSAWVNYPWSPLHCFYCTSIWVAFFMAFATPSFFLYWFALSAGAILMYELMGGSK